MLLMRYIRTDGQTREDRATQPIDAGWLIFAIQSLVAQSIQFNVDSSLGKIESPLLTQAYLPLEPSPASYCC